MSKIRNCAMVLGLAGALLMVTADTKEVKATEKITYEKEAGSVEGLTSTIGTQIIEHTEKQIELLRLEKEQEEREELENQKLKRVYDLSEADYAALTHLVEAEASGEDLKGKMLVANVVLNRTKDKAFPDTVEEVVYQKKGKKAQFSPVATGKIHQVTVSQETIEAVERVLCGEDESQGALYFAARKHASAENMRWFDTHLTHLFTHDGHEFFA